MQLKQVTVVEAVRVHNRRHSSCHENGNSMIELCMYPSRATFATVTQWPLKLAKYALIHTVPDCLEIGKCFGCVVHDFPC